MTDEEILQAVIDSINAQVEPEDDLPPEAIEGAAKDFLQWLGVIR